MRAWREDAGCEEEKLRRLAWLGGFRAMIDGLVLGSLTLSYIPVVVLHCNASPCTSSSRRE